MALLRLDTMGGRLFASREVTAVNSIGKWSLSSQENQHLSVTVHSLKIFKGMGGIDIRTPPPTNTSKYQSHEVL